MKKAVILHGTGSGPKEHWFPWLKSELEKIGYEVWVPELPEAKLPNIERYNQFLLASGWDFSDNLIIGHSSGAVAVNGLLQALPESVEVNTAILAGIYRGDLGREDLEGTNIEFDYEKIRKQAKKIVVFHSDDDPTCPLEGAKWIAQKLRAKLRIIHGRRHMSENIDGSDITEIPELLEIIRHAVV